MRITKPHTSLGDGGKGPDGSSQAAADQDKLFQKFCSMKKKKKEESFQQYLLVSVTQE